MTDNHYAAARAEAIEEGAVTPRDRAAQALMRNTEDGLPHWTDDLDDQGRSHWRSEADVMLGNLLDRDEVARIIFSASLGDGNRIMSAQQWADVSAPTIKGDGRSPLVSVRRAQHQDVGLVAWLTRREP